MVSLTAPNHALQRTAPRVTLAAADHPATFAHPAPAVVPQPARRAPQSLSLGSLAIDGSTSLDAAHIHQFKRGGVCIPGNGLALSKSAHWLFDRGFWSLTDDFRVLVRAGKFDESGDAGHLLKPRAGSVIHLPHDRVFWPDRDCLA